jgi:ring-1,2-phenylacetyl-CoA epoxidase subunit PaaC
VSTVATSDSARAADLPDGIRDAVRDLILVLADSKRLLGMRYGQWILGAPELEAGIACASMAQDEWGHARLLYALLKDFGEDVDHLEHGRSADEYRSIDALDREPESWPALVTINALVDTALTVQLEALARSSYTPLRQRVQKLIEEESFHHAHAAAWFRRIAGSGDAGRSHMRAAVERVLPAVLRWFGPDTEQAQALPDAGISDASGTALRERFLDRTTPLLNHAGESLAAATSDFSDFDERRRRGAGTAPDERTIAQVRGDRNRAFLMD